jgi:hypothetical protein
LQKTTTNYRARHRLVFFSWTRWPWASSLIVV